jgi:predicted nucleic acid-binding protein
MKLVDADVLIDLSKRRDKAVRYFAGIADFTIIGVSVMTKLELLDGAENKRELFAILDFFEAFGFSDAFPSEASLNLGVEFFTSYHLSHGMGIFDSLLAGIAVTTSSRLVTRNQKHFDFIPYLKLEIPY